jgi:hypothetical protein
MEDWMQVLVPLVAEQEFHFHHLQVSETVLRCLAMVMGHWWQEVDPSMSEMWVVSKAW